MGVILDKATAIAEAKDELRSMLPPGSTVWTILRHRAASGMTRWISPIVLTEVTSFGRTTTVPWDITYLVVRTGIFSRDDKHEGVKIGGAGMDMGFHLVYELSQALYPEGFECIGDQCPSNDHSNGDRNYKPHRHNDGGYALERKWL